MSALQWTPAAVLAVIVVAVGMMILLTRTGVWARGGDSVTARQEQQQQVLAATKRCFSTVNTYDYRKLGGLVARDAACATGKFKADLKKALRKTILPMAPKQKAVQTAQVNKAGIVSVDSNGNQWTILIYAQLSISNTVTGTASPRIDLLGAVVTVDRVGDKWLMSKVDSDVGNGLGS